MRRNGGGCEPRRRAWPVVPAVHALTQALQTGDVPLRVEAAAMLSRIKDPARVLPWSTLILDPEGDGPAGRVCRA